MAETITPAAPPADLAAYKAMKAERAAGTTTPPVEKQASSSVPEGETAAAPEAPNQEPQEKQGKRKAANAEERAAELRAAGRVKEADKILSDDAEQKEYNAWKAGKADRDRDAEELRKLRARPEVAAPAAPPAEVKPAAASPAEGKPKLKDFLAKPENKAKEYEDVVEDWEDACATWRKGQEKAEAEKGKLNTSFNEKVEAARKVHADYDAVTSGANFQATLLKLAPNAVAVAAHELPHGVEVLYQLASDPDECRRIAGLSPTSQLIEMGVMSRELVKAEATPAIPEKPQRPAPVSKTPPPARNLGGIAPASPSATNGAKTLEEYKRQKAERARA